MSVAPHTHQDLEDRITLEIAALRGDLAALDGRLIALNAKVTVIDDRMRQGFDEMRRGFTGITQVLGQILGRLPDDKPEGDDDDG